MAQQQGQSHSTKDHEEIKKWVEERGGAPAMVARTHEKEGSGMLRIDFPGYSGKQSLEHVDWDEFFKVFDSRGLTFLYQEKTRDGEESRFFKFVREGGKEKK